MINNVPAAAMIFNAHVINLRVYNAGQNVLRQQAALHFAPPPPSAAPPSDKQEEEAAPNKQQRGRWRGGGRK